VTTWTLKSYFAANPKVAGDLQTIAHPLTGLLTPSAPAAPAPSQPRIKTAG
jgi:hypothetical protein